MSFVQQAEASSVSNPGFVTTPAITTTAGNLLWVIIQYDDTQTPVLSSSQSDVFTAIPAAVTDFTAARVKIAAYYATAVGGSTTFTNTVGGSGLGIYVAEYSPVGALSGPGNAAYQNGPGLGADVVSSGLVGSSGSVLLLGFSVDAQFGAAPSAGTTPNALTGRTAVWAARGGGTACALPEDIFLTGNAAATFGTVSGNQFNNFVTVAAAFSVGGTFPPVPQSPHLFTQMNAALVR